MRVIRQWKDARTRKEQHNGLEWVEQHAHGLADDPAEGDDEWNDKESNLLRGIRDTAQR